MARPAWQSRLVWRGGRTPGGGLVHRGPRSIWRSQETEILMFDTTRELFWIGALLFAREHIGHGLSDDDLRVLAAAGEMDDGEKRPDDAVALARELWARHVGNTFSTKRTDTDRLKAQTLSGTATALSPDTMVAVRELLKNGGDIEPASVHVAKTALETLVIMALPERRLRNTWKVLGSDDLAGFAELNADSACADAMARDEGPADLAPDLTGAERIAAVQERWARRWLDLDAGEQAHFRGRYIAHAGAFLSTVDRGFIAEHPNPSEAAELLPSAQLPGGRRALWLDSALMVYLRRMVGPGKGKVAELVAELVDGLEAEAAQRWADWTGEPRQTELTPASLAERTNTVLMLWNVTSEAPGWMRVIARVVWLVDVGPKIQRGKDNPPALVRVLAEPAARIMVAARIEGGAVFEVGAGRRGRLPVALAPAGTASGPELELLGSLTAQRLFRWLVRTAHRRWLNGEQTPGVLVIPGGYEALANAIGVTSKAEIARLPVILRDLHRSGLQWRGDGRSGEVSLIAGFEDDDRQYRGHARELVIEVPTMLLPGAVKRAGLTTSPGKHLIPVLDLPNLSAIGARLQPRGALLDWLAVAELRAGAADVVTFGGVLMPWEKLAVRARLDPERDVPRLLASWSPDRWENIGNGRWNLADSPATGDARRFILAAGEEEIAGAQKGREGVKKKRQRLNLT